jgi:hypothetical protein
MVLIK